jgi:hypothetical protein
MSKKHKNKKRQTFEKVADTEFHQTYEVEGPTLIFTPSKPKRCKINKHDFNTIKGTDFGILTTSLAGASAGLLIVVLTKITIALLHGSGIDHFEFDLWSLGISVILSIFSFVYESNFPSDRSKLINRIKKFFDE